MLTNYHTHTTRCGHAEGTEEEYILTALRCGYRVLGFSDHTPWAYATPGFVSRIRMLPSQPDDYVLTCAGCGRNMPTSSTSASALRQSISRPIWLAQGRDGAAGHRISHPRLSLRHHRRAGRQSQPLRRQHLHGPRQAVCRTGGGSAGNGALPVSGPPRPLFEPGDGLRRRRRESLPGHLCRSGAAGHSPRVQHGRTDPARPPRRLFRLHPGRVLAHRGGVTPVKASVGCDATPPRSWTSSPPSRKRKPSCTAWASRCWTPCQGWNKRPLRGRAASAILRQEE